MTREPDVLLIAAEWRSRALLRAELAARGVAPLAVDTWPTGRQVLLSRLKPPALVVVDLQDLTGAERLLTELAALVPADCVLVLTSPSALPMPVIQRRGFTHVVSRPFTIGEIAATVQRLLGASPQDSS